MLYIETSAKESIGVNQVFEELVTKVLESPVLMESLGFKASTISVTPTDHESEASGCYCSYVCWKEGESDCVVRALLTRFSDLFERDPILVYCALLPENEQ